MKQSEIEKCRVCGKGVMHDRNITFYRIKIDYLVVDIEAIHRQAGLEMFMGSAEIAAVMGPNEDIAKEISSLKGLICLDCSMETPIGVLADLFQKRVES